MKSSPPADVGPADPRPSRTAIFALACVIVCPVVLAFDLIVGWSVQPALAVVNVAGLILAHVALFRIRKSNGALTGIGFCAAALVVGYATLAIGLLTTALLTMTVNRFGN